MIEHRDTLTIDERDVLIDEAEAIYEIDAIWSRPNARNQRTVEHVNSCTLARWMSGPFPQSRDIAVSLAGEAWVRGQERLALERWRANAETNDDAERADEAISV